MKSEPQRQFIRFAGAVAACGVLCATLSAPSSAGVIEYSTVYTPGESGYNCFRIPTIVKANDGTLMAFAEGRVNSCSDFGNIDVVLKRSTDGGRTWGSLLIIDSFGANRSHSTAPVVDRSTGDIILPFMRDDQPYLRRSSNNGLTWTGPASLASQVFPGTWSSMGFGPVHSIQLEHGLNAGRLVVPGKHILAGQNLEPDGRESHVIYSDDGGTTWSVGAIFRNPNAGFGPNEATVVELNDGSLYMSTRNQGGGARNRLVGVSPDGIQAFDGDPNDGVVSSVVETDLADAQVQGSLLRASEYRIIHTHIANDTTDRYRLSISSSFDEAQTWTNRKLIHRTLASYSDLVQVQGSELGLIYEAGSTGATDEIRFGWFDESWLDDPTAVHYNFDPANLSLTGGPKHARSTQGFDYDALAFLTLSPVDGSDDYEGGGALRFVDNNIGDTLRLFDATDANNLEFEHEDSFTIEAVFKSSAHAADTGVIFEKSESGNDDGAYSLELVNGKLRFHIQDLAGNQTNLLSTSDLNDGQWHHVAAIRDAGLNRLILYIDHQFAGTVIDLTTGDLGDIGLGQAEIPFIGSGADALDEFDGDLQHLRIAMAALTPEQFIQKLAAPLEGDLDGDGFVGISDLNIVLGAWNQTVPPADPQADPTDDGFVGIEDLNLVLGNWNNGTPPQLNPIPEPGSGLSLIGAGIVCLLRKSSRATRPQGKQSVGPALGSLIRFKKSIVTSGMKIPRHLFVVMCLYAALPLGGSDTSASALLQTDVFVSGQEGYHTFRIPAIVEAADNTLLAFAEGRKNSGSDTGDIDLVLKRSTDGGLTWGPLQVVGDNGSNVFGNPAPIVDTLTGKVVLLTTHNAGNVTESQIRNGSVSDAETRRVFVQESHDHGATWTPAVEITADTKQPNWRWYATGPVHGIQLTRGEHAGRLIVPSDHSTDTLALGAHLIYSDDGGSTWQIGAVDTPTTSFINPNESAVVELTDGRIYTVTRDQHGTSPGNRASTYSSDGGVTFDATHAIDPSLVSPVVQASVLRYAATDQGDLSNRILFSSPGDPSSRVKMTVRSSFDETDSWDAGKLIYRGRSAYSDMVKTQDANVGLLYEWGATANYQRIRFATFTEQWLDDSTVLRLDFDEQTTGSAPNSPGLLEDSEGYGLHGTASNGPTFVAGDPRYNNGAALRFTGGTDEVRIDDAGASILDFEGVESFTLEAVFKTTDHSGTSANDSGPLISKDLASTSPSYWLRIQDSRVRFLVSDNNSEPNLYSDVTVNDGQWHHVAAVRDADAGTLSLYVDYVFAGSVTDTTTGDFGNANDLLIGAFNDSTGTTNKQFNGDIDFVRVSQAALDPLSFVQPDLAGDLDGDGFVGISDLNIVLGAWNQTVPPADPRADPTGDGFVGIEDLNLVLGNWNNGTPPQTARIPEPAISAIFMLLFGYFVKPYRMGRPVRNPTWEIAS